MGLSQDWQQLPGQTKMFIIGGGATALFILFIAIRGKGSTTKQQQANTQATLDPSGWIDAQTQQTQYIQRMIDGINSTVTQNQQANTQAIDQNNKALQQAIAQNQQATQQQIQTLLGNMPKAPIYSPPPAPPSPPAPAAPKTPVPKPTMMGNMQYATPSGGWDQNSVVDFIKSHGGYADFASRKVLASQMGIQNYTGSAEQNINMLNNLRNTYA